MRRRAPLAAGLAALAVAGCGGSKGADAGDGGPVASTTDGPTTARTTTVEVVRRGGGTRFDPAEIYERDAPGVVTVFAIMPGGSGDASDQGLGSGFVVNARGEIATNAHVVTAGTGSAIRKASEVYVAFADGNRVQARIVGYDANADIALLRIERGALGGVTLRPLPLGTAQDLRVGSPVAAIGSPFGEPQSLSVGVVSATDRSIRSLTGFEIAGAIQTDAAINRGNSGGPLVNGHGEVLGVNSQIQTTSGGGEGVGYAIPADTVRRTLAQLRRKGRVDYAYLGVSTTAIYPQLAERFKLPVRAGAWVQEVVAGSPAEEAGLRAGGDRRRFQGRAVNDGGDIIVAIGGRTLADEAALGVELLRLVPGQDVMLRIYREGERREVRVKLGARPVQSDAAIRP